MRRLAQRTEAVVSLSALEHNVSRIREIIGDGVEIMAVLKGDGYGHGEKGIYSTLKKCGIERYAVAVWEEGASLREAGCTEPVLLLGDTCDGQLENIIKYNLTPAIFSYDTAQKLNMLARWSGVVCPVHLKIDTGMSRIGFSADERSIELIQRINTLENLRITGAFTHFARADEADGVSAKAQFEKYICMLERLEDAGVRIPCKHVANSPAILLRPETRLDAVRAGDILFGLCPIDEDDWAKADFRQVMHWAGRHRGRLRRHLCCPSPDKNRHGSGWFCRRLQPRAVQSGHGENQRQKGADYRQGLHGSVHGGRHRFAGGAARRYRHAARRRFERAVDGRFAGQKRGRNRLRHFQARPENL